MNQVQILQQVITVEVAVAHSAATLGCWGGQTGLLLLGIIKSLRDTKPLDSFRCQKTIEYGEQKFDERINLAFRMFIHLWITDRILQRKHHEEG